MSRRVQKVMETRVEEIRMAKAKGRGDQGRSRKKMEGVRNEKEKGEENSRGKESGRRMGDLG